MEKKYLTENLEILPSENLLSVNKNGQIKTIRIENQLLNILLIMAEDIGRMVPRNVFIDKIWEGNENVAKQALTKNIYKLRALFKNEGLENSISIETITGKGYRLIVSKSNKPNGHFKKGLILGFALGALSTFGMSYIYQNMKDSKNKTEIIRLAKYPKDTVLFISTEG